MIKKTTLIILVFLCLCACAGLFEDDYSDSYYDSEESVAYQSDPVNLESAAKIYAVKTDPSGRYLAASGVINGSENVVFIWDLYSGTLIDKLSGHTGNIYSIDIDSLGRYMVSGGQDNKIIIWDFKTREKKHEFTHIDDDGITSVVFDPSGFYLFVGGTNASLCHYSVLYPELPYIYSPKHDDRISILAVDPLGDYIASGSNDSTIAVWSYRGFFDNRIRRYSMSCGNRLTALCFSASGEYLYSGDTDGTLQVWNVTDGSLEGSIDAHSGTLWWITQIPEGEKFFTGGEDGNINVWEYESGELLHTINDGQEIQSLLVHPGGKILFSGGFDSRINLWDTGSYENIAAFYAFTDGSLVVTNDGYYSGTGSFRSYINDSFFPKEMENNDEVVKALRQQLLSGGQ